MAKSREPKKGAFSMARRQSARGGRRANAGRPTPKRFRNGVALPTAEVLFMPRHRLIEEDVKRAEAGLGSSGGV